MADLEQFAVELLHGRRIATLATHNPDGDIHLTAVWYMYKDDKLYVPTNSRSRKVRNVKARPRAAVMVESRKEGFEQGVTARGTATIIRDEEAQAIRKEVQARYVTETGWRDPKVANFYATSDDVVICLTPASWSSWDIGQMNAREFDGLLSTETGYLYPLE